MDPRETNFELKKNSTSDTNMNSGKKKKKKKKIKTNATASQDNHIANKSSEDPMDNILAPGVAVGQNFEDLEISDEKIDDPYNSFGKSDKPNSTAGKTSKKNKNKKKLFFAPPVVKMSAA